MPNDPPVDETTYVAPSQEELAMDLYKDLLKNTIVLPLEACKSMATGCATVAGLYGAALTLVKFQQALSPNEAKTYLILVPFLLFSIAGYLFGRAYLPTVRLSELVPITSAAESSKPVEPTTQAETLGLLHAREVGLRTAIVAGSSVFWLGLAWAISVVVFAHVL